MMQIIEINTEVLTLLRLLKIAKTISSLKNNTGKNHRCVCLLWITNFVNSVITTVMSMTKKKSNGYETNGKKDIWDYQRLKFLPGEGLE